MAESSSNQGNTMEVYSRESLIIKPRTTVMDKKELTLLIESAVDFESTKRNGIDVLPYIGTKDLDCYFEMLHGPTYRELVKDFWIRAEVYDRDVAELEERQKVAKNSRLKGNTREEMGLPEFKEVEVRLAVKEIRVTITKEMLAKSARCTNYGMFEINVKKDSHWMEKVYKTLYEGRPTYKTCDMKNEQRVLRKLILERFMPKDGDTNYRSRDHNLFLHFLIHNYMIDFPKYMFNYL